MIYDASTFALPASLSTDLCVIGSGAGGMMAAMVAAEAGVHTLVLEAGELVTPQDMSQREEQMFPRLFWDSANRATRDTAVKIHQGRGVGGSTLHNQNLCKRIPRAIRERWAKSRGLSHLDLDTWDGLYAEVERLLGVEPIPLDQRNKANQLLERGVQALGWKGGGLAHNRRGCTASGFCELGCSYDGKNNASKILLPRAVAAGAQVVSLCQATRLIVEGGAVRGVEAVALDRRTRRPLGRLSIWAQRVCVAGSATSTAALLLRSGVHGPPGSTGDTLRIHPAVVAAGDFDEEVRAWDGVPQSYECTEMLDLEAEASELRTWILTAFAHPIGTATLVPDHGEAHRALMHRYGHLAVLANVVHDETCGQVRPDGELGLSLDYWPVEADRRALSLGLWASAKLLFAAGAQRVWVPTRKLVSIERGESFDFLKSMGIERHELAVVAVHPMGTVPMGDDPKVAAVGSDGRHHHVRNLWVADGSLFPTSIGVPPQISIYTMGLHVGRALSR